MSINTTRVGKYAEPTRLPVVTGGDAQAQFGRMKARLVARYKLAAVRGREEELVSPGTDRGVSLGYSGRTIRVRLMVGRNWTHTHDFQVEDGWQGELHAMCDPHFGYDKDTPTATSIPLVVS